MYITHATTTDLLYYVYFYAFAVTHTHTHERNVQFVRVIDSQGGIKKRRIKGKRKKKIAREI